MIPTIVVPVLVAFGAGKPFWSRNALLKVYLGEELSRKSRRAQERRHSRKEMNAYRWQFSKEKPGAGISGANTVAMLITWLKKSSNGYCYYNKLYKNIFMMTCSVGDRACFWQFFFIVQGTNRAQSSSEWFWNDMRHHQLATRSISSLSFCSLLLFSERILYTRTCRCCKKKLHTHTRLHFIGRK